jgi:hypothetical protein
MLVTRSFVSIHPFAGFGAKYGHGSGSALSKFFINEAYSQLAVFSADARRPVNIIIPLIAFISVPILALASVFNMRLALIFPNSFELTNFFVNLQKIFTDLYGRCEKNDKQTKQ